MARGKKRGPNVTTMHVIDARRLAGHFISHFSKSSVATPRREFWSVSGVLHTYGRSVLESAALFAKSYKVWCAQELELATS